jgi:hypothetical protein
MKFSRAISWVRWFSFVETNVSETISVLILRVVELINYSFYALLFTFYLHKQQGKRFIKMAYHENLVRFGILKTSLKMQTSAEEYDNYFLQTDLYQIKNI